MLDKTYSAQDVETRVYEAWEQTGAFDSGRSDGRPFTIVIPPPNVTGSLHIGHALNNTLQDILCRFERMRGRDVLWQPGTDHAGIATQMVVERQLAEQGIDRRAIGREEFVRRVWNWKEQSGGTIINQLRHLGASCDWRRERFTMDEGLSRAVLKVFVRLYKEGLIYRDKRLVNWDPKLGTAISDLEVESREVDGQLWYFRYPLADDPSRHVVVATTRPETMLGDTAVAVHPDDARYRDIVGRDVMLPLADRRIPVVADEHSDPEKGSGAVKITPAHDFNDFEVGRRHGLPMINILDAGANLNDAVPEAYRGMERYAARKKVVADMEALGLLEKVETQRHAVPYGDRGGVPIEPWLTDQWYVDAATLARPAIDAVERGEIRFVPRNWEKTYFEWMRNIEPWCISRQLWWGHQIPAWYGPDGEVFVEETEEAAAAAAQAHYGRAVALTRDDDVLDTWFSSALWPFSTMGWPDQTPELARYYKTDVLVTGFDIIFFWVARMVMMGIHFMGEVPFHTVYVHALVRDEKGQKMSKSKGNVMDPLDLVSAYGADAVRFTLAAMAAQGRDIKLSEQRIEGYRNFGTKLWNAARFTEMNGCVAVPGWQPDAVSTTLNRWIVDRLGVTAATVTEALEAYRFNDAAAAVYQFTWGTFCDWYLELAKPVLTGGDGPEKTETQACCAWLLGQILHLLQPFMPFVAEELWDRLYRPVLQADGWLMHRPWPDAAALPRDPEAAAELEWVIALIGEVRGLRSEMNVPASARIEMIVNGADDAQKAWLDRHGEAIGRLARLETLSIDAAVPAGSAQLVLGEVTAVLPLANVIDLEQEKQRLSKQIDKLAGEIRKIEGKLGNASFLARAPEHVVEEQREQHEQAQATAARLRQALARLG
ncbi:valine--tRNA ligase [Marinibaculum pumilum]|uniref:Valine--tRNA ligase n=1 Tax=Marinibaculum pumilum TaxID=1766165 RepID=A0ABV7KWR2_9PROT